MYLFLSLAGPLCFLWLQATFLVSAFRLQDDLNQKKLSIIPYLTLLVNCIIWSIYATMTELFALFIPNSIGIFVGCYCCVAYHKYSHIQPPPYYFLVAAAVTMTGMMFALFGMEDEIGMLAIILSVSVYASPLSTLKTVIRDKSTMSMPFR